ncbi:MAG: hypothetical protein S4CHLAM81_10150 [Chlamydiales bacterium]|nr:hypothetical protein [Chlamydiales bacterium]MCH9635793.1 hypothetical protein [Chlamydiales bacterium]MCH9704363.1 hypothetical protein [Chlamydiota bacterium]
MSNPVPHNPAMQWHHGGMGKPTSRSGMGDQMSNAMGDGINKVANFFDQSRWRQMSFAWIVMPVITLVAMRFFFGASFFHHGLAGMKNPGMQAFMGLPIVGVLGATTVELMVNATFAKRPAIRNRIKCVTKLAALAIYAAVFSYMMGHLISQNGMIGKSYSTPISQHTNFLHNINHPYQISANGFLTSSWPGMMIVAGLPLGYFAKGYFEEFAKTSHEMALSGGTHKAETLAERRKERRHVQKLHMEQIDKERQRAEAYRYRQPNLGQYDMLDLDLGDDEL